jgi:hypothetical protein
MRDPYPESIREVLDEEMKFRPEALAAVRAFARSKPWRGTLVERWRKFLTVNRDLAAAYGIEPPTLILRGNGTGDSGASFYLQQGHVIVMRGRLSVVTFLHEFAHALGKGERGACRWSLNLFRRYFPRSFDQCQPDRHMLRWSP